MVFSYGFLEGGVTDARQLFLDLDMPSDDPLRLAKMGICDDAPGFRLFTPPGTTSTEWESASVWWSCVNEEDGLEFRVLQSNDGSKDLKVAWKGKDITSSDRLKDILSAEHLWDIFQLRAIITVQARIDSQLSMLQESEEQVVSARDTADEGREVRSKIWDTAMKVRRLEAELLERALHDLELKVRAYMQRNQAQIILDKRIPEQVVLCKKADANISLYTENTAARVRHGEGLP
jgi:hypothetical protein